MNEEGEWVITIDMGIHQRQAHSVPVAVTEISVKLVHINYM